MKRRLLIVDDDKEDGETFAMILGFEGFEASWVSTASDALADLARGPVEGVWICLDVAGALDLLQQIRERFPSIVVLAAVGFSGPLLVPEAKRAGAAAILCPPFDMNEVLSTVDQLLPPRARE